VPFVVTIIVALIFSTYMLFQPAGWLFRLMQLTEMSTWFKDWLMVLALAGFLAGYVAERHIFPELARVIGRVYWRLRPSKKKQRRKYKVLLEEMGR
jgi:cation-transporting ATPase 13A3/4/5